MYFFFLNVRRKKSGAMIYFSFVLLRRTRVVGYYLIQDFKEKARNSICKNTNAGGKKRLALKTHRFGSLGETFNYEIISCLSTVSRISTRLNTISRSGRGTVCVHRYTYVSCNSFCNVGHRCITAV